MSENLSGTEIVAEDLSDETTDTTPAAAAATETPSLDYGEDDSSTVDADEAIDDQPSDTSDGGDPAPSEVYYEIDGVETSLETIKQWQSGHMMQSDYSKKTKETKDLRDQLAADRQALDQKVAFFKDAESGLETALLGDLLDGVNLDELIDTDPGRYLRITKQLEDKKKVLSELAASRAKVQEELHRENYQALHTSMGWDDEAKQKADRELIVGFAKRTGIPEARFATYTDPQVMQAFAIAEQAMRVKDEKPEISKRVVVTPRSGKPSGVPAASKPKTLAERMYPAKKAG